MKKRYIHQLFWVVLLLFFSNSVSAQESSIRFEKKTWNEILIKAQKENKLVFLDAYTSWCGPCKLMAKKTFTDSDVAVFFNQKFVNAKFDMEKGEGLVLAKKYEIKAYPTLLFVNGKGEKVHFAIGYLTPKQLMEKASVALDSENNFLALKKRFQTGETSAKFVLQYASLLQSANMPIQEVLERFWAKNIDSHNSESWKVIVTFENNTNSAKFQEVQNNLRSYVSAFGKKEVYNYLADAYFIDILADLRQGTINKNNYHSEIEKVKKIPIPNAEQVVARADVLFYKFLQPDEEKAIEAMEILLNKYQENSPKNIVRYAQAIIQSKVSAKRYKQSCEWMRKLVLPKERTAENLFIYATLLERVGEYKKAETIANEALGRAETKYEKKLIQLLETLAAKQKK